jgi:hypothetical protein
VVDARKGKRKRMKGLSGKEIEECMEKLISLMSNMSFLEKVDTLNQIRSRLHDISPFKNEPVDFVKWESLESVIANDYNPNAVAPPEMELLRISIDADGYTQPVVTHFDDEDNKSIVVDGFHRNRVARECDTVKERVKGYLPIVQIRNTQIDRGNRIASTIRHNRARGKHQVEKMSDIVLELKRRNWSDKKIGKELGMDPDEVLRLAQITGLAEAFKDHEFSLAWDVDQSADDDTVLTYADDIEEVFGEG